METARTRRVDPVYLGSEGRNLYLYGWCHQRDDMRNFRVDRIQGLTLLDEQFDPDHYRSAVRELERWYSS